MAMAFSYIAKHSRIFFLSMHLSTNTFQKTFDFSHLPCKNRQTLISLPKGEKIFGYIVGYIAIAELKAKNFNQSHSHLQPFGYSCTIAEWLKADLVKWLGYDSAWLYEKLYYRVNRWLTIILSIDLKESVYFSMFKNNSDHGDARHRL